jgi:hypothetical protein
MPTEINLPTKTTQDSIKVETDKIQSIKNDTTSILGNFPISGGTDWSETIPKLAGSESGSASNTIIDITGSGYLFSITSVNTSNVNNNVYIDGVLIGNFKASYSSGVSGVFRFNNSLKVVSDTQSRWVMVGYSLE